MKGFWFSNGKLGFGDGRVARVGGAHRIKGEPVLCCHGLHASKIAFDALQYAAGMILFKVELGGKIKHGSDKSVSTDRKYIAKINAEVMLRKFARKCALDVVHLWDCPDVVLQYLKTGDEKLMAAAWAAARAAAWAAARDAAGDAAGDAARAAAEDAEREWQTDRLMQYLRGEV